MSNTNELELKNKIIYRKLASEDSLCIRPLELSEIKKMHSLVFRYHELFNADNLQAAIDRPQISKDVREQVEKAIARDWYDFSKDEGSRQQRLSELHSVANEFQKLYPQMTSDEFNTTQIVNLLKQQERMFTLPNVISAYQELCGQAMLEIIPSLCGLIGDAPVKGRMLTSIPNWERVLNPVVHLTDKEKEEIRIQNMDSESFRREFLPASKSQREIDHNKKLAAEFEKKFPTFDADAEGAWDILLNYLKEHQLGFRMNELALAFHECQGKLRAIDALWDQTKETEYRAGVSSLVDRRVQKSPLPSRDVVIKQPDTPKRFSMQEINSWSADEFLKKLQEYPNLQSEIDNF